MNLNFDTFEFVGLIAPGSVVVLVIALLHPQLFHLGDPIVTIVVGAVVAYIAGHLVAAIGNIAELLWKKRPVASMPISLEDWSARSGLTADQGSRFLSNVRLLLHRTIPEEIQRTEQSTLLKQMFVAVYASGHGQRVEAFNGLFNLSRGLAVSLLIAAIIAALAGRNQLAFWDALAFALALFRTWKFKDAYRRELFEQFLLLPLEPRRVDPRCD